MVSTSVAQNLEDLVDESEEEEQEIRRIPGTETRGVMSEGMDSRLRLPADDDVQRLRIAQDRQIDPDEYIVGPGDVMQLYIWGESDQDIPFEVNPEGQALVPTIGTFEIAGRSLTEAKQVIIEAAREKYPSVDISLTLQSMRFFTAYVTGAVFQSESAHVISPVTRVSDIIDLAGGFHGGLTKQPTARRSVKILHEDGTFDEVDISMFLSTGDIEQNPYVRMGDVIHVGFRIHQVFAYGSVNAEGAQEYRAGDTIGDLLRLAQGVESSAPLAHAELWRFVAGTDSIVVIPLIHEESDRLHTVDEIAHVPLMPKDMLFIRTRSDWQQTPTVHAHGAILYVGRYRIVEGQTRILDFLDEAGGLTDQANLLEARIIRTKYRATEDPELQRIQALVGATGLSDLIPEERAYLKTKQREEKGRLTVDFQLLLEGDRSQNVLLEGGDVIHVPLRRSTVNMSGQLVKPGLLAFEEGRRAGYYMEKAGGYAFDADKGGARLIRARTGRREDYNRNLIVKPGDEIWVPEKEYRDWWGFVQGTMRTTMEALTLLILVRAI
jgi:protein involved in polysaccharide export with SLBB domain